MASCVADGPPAAIELGEGSGGRVVVQLVGGALDLASLLPRCAAALHHGGAGTCAAALLAGTPQLWWPCFFDQAAWAERLEHQGVGARPGRAELDLTLTLTLTLTRTRTLTPTKGWCSNKTTWWSASIVNAKQLHTFSGSGLLLNPHRSFTQVLCSWPDDMSSLTLGCSGSYSGEWPRTPTLTPTLHPKPNPEPHPNCEP